MSDLTKPDLTDRWLRLFVTLCVPALVLFLERFPLPIFRFASIRGHNFATMASASDFDAAPFSLFSLGVNPILSAFFLVEVCALIVPPWRRLRITGANGRARLWRATLILTFIAGLAQSYGIARSLQGSRLLANTAPAALLLMSLLMLGLAALLALIELVSRRGLGNGFSVLLAAGALSDLASDLTDGPVSFSKLALPLAAIAAAALATFFVLRRPPLNNSSTSSDLTLWLPTCGVVALIWATSAVELPATLFNMGLDVHGLGHHLYPRRGFYAFCLFILVVAFGLLFSWLFNHRARAGKIWSRFAKTEDRATGEARAARLWPAATFKSIIYLLLLASVNFAIDRLTRLSIELVPIAIVTAVLLDLSGEWKYRGHARPVFPAWPIHRVYAVDAARRTLQNAGIDSYPRGANHRVLFQFFGPFVPIELMVPAARLEDAKALLRPLLVEERGALPAAAIAGKPIS